jgi:hypothetical protein
MQPLPPGIGESRHMRGSTRRRAKRWMQRMRLAVIFYSHFPSGFHVAPRSHSFWVPEFPLNPPFSDTYDTCIAPFPVLPQHRFPPINRNLNRAYWLQVTPSIHDYSKVDLARNNT